MGQSVFVRVRYEAAMATNRGDDQWFVDGAEYLVLEVYLDAMSDDPASRALLRVVAQDTPILQDAASLAAVMAAGADGALLGSAFLASEEAPAFHPRAKEVIVDSDGSDTVWTRAYDIAMGLDFGPGIGARVHANAFTRRWDGREHVLAEQREVVAGHLRAFDSEPDDEAWLMYGQSAAFVDAVQPIADIMRELETGLEPIRLP